MGLADLHIHTIHSIDGTATIPAVLARARQVGLDVIAITDHDEIAGSRKAVELAPAFGVEVIPGMEVTTAEGDLLALNITEKIKRDLPLVETIQEVSDLGGFCVAPHPMANGIGMKSLSAYSISKALRHPRVARSLIAVETYNATTLDRMSNHYARILSEWLDLTPIASSDAHVLEAIGLGTTQFEGHTAEDLLAALQNGSVRHCKQKEWSSLRILGSWAANYVKSTLTRRSIATG